MDIMTNKAKSPFNPRWAALQAEFRALARKWPTLNAYRRRIARSGTIKPKTNDDRHEGLTTKTEWTFDGPYMAVQAFKELASEAAGLLGCHATKEIQVQFFCDHLFGDHVLFNERPRFNDDDTEYMTTDSSGNRQGWRGRQKI